tara:strand:- start:558 stop:764 length:207 start_codon:yes stop_codon:yes gene_type:complete
MSWLILPTTPKVKTHTILINYHKLEVVVGVTVETVKATADVVVVAEAAMIHTATVVAAVVVIRVWHQF